MILFLVILILLLAAVWILTRCRRDHKDLPLLRQYQYAHRGLHNKPQVPENSMMAFQKAVEQGYGAELDVHLMKDGNLAVIHDSSLKRTAGADVCIEDLEKADLERFVLEDSQERIPLLEEVLALFRGKTPLIIELKAERGNHAALAAAVAKRLDTYDGDCCIESFDPRVVSWFRKNRPQVCRGQLSENCLRDSDAKLSGATKFLLTNLLTNVAAFPDFVAYKVCDRKNPGLRLCRLLWRPQLVYWTLRTKEEAEAAKQDGALCIFENVIP